MICLKIYQKDNQIRLKCREIVQLGNLYETPIQSTKLDILWCATAYKNPARTLGINDFKRKMFAVPYNESSMVFAPLKIF